MKTKHQEFTFKYIGNDLPAGLVVFLVALPLCLGIALASQAPLFSGIIAGVLGGLVVGALSGSPLSVSGPAAGLTVIVASAISSLGSFEVFLLAVALAGVLQVILGLLKAGIIGYYFPSSVIKGMLAAIGIILILKQIPHALGYDKDAEGDFDFIQTDGANTFTEIVNAVYNAQSGAVIIALVALAILLIWDRPALKKFKFFQIVPGALFAVLSGVFLNMLFGHSLPQFHMTGDTLVSLPVASDANEFFGFFSTPDFDAITNPKVWIVALTIAIIASLETLLSIEAADKLDPYKRDTPTNRELIAQGLGNLTSGLIGGLPMTAVIVRTSANVNAGGRTKLSAMFHSLLLLIAVVLIAPLLNQIPLACLAALLILTGYKLAKISLFKSMYKAGWAQFIPFLITVLAIQFSDLLKGIGIGMVVALFFILRNYYMKAYSIKESVSANGSRHYEIELSEEITFLSKGSIGKFLHGLPDNCQITINGKKLTSIDPDVLEIIHDFRSTAELKEISVELIAIPAFEGSGSAH
jgi:MFS superfamily sulfate permease-like transporter